MRAHIITLTHYLLFLISPSEVLLQENFPERIERNDENNLNVIETRVSDIGKVTWTTDEEEIPTDMQNICDGKPGFDEKKVKPCYCSQYWEEDKSDIEYFCCKNCIQLSGCFPPTARVLSPARKEITMSSLKTGTPVMAVDQNGKLVESVILGFLDRQPQLQTMYSTLVTSSGETLTLTPSHIVFKSQEHFEEPSPVFAKEVQVGDFIFETANNTLKPSEVIDIRSHLQKGAYVPMTKEGNLIIDGHYVSCYASYPHELSHNYLGFLRTFPWLISFRTGSEEGCEGPLEDYASEEGCGESLYVTLGKSLPQTFLEMFFENSFSLSKFINLPEMSSLFGIGANFIGLSS